MQRTVELYYPPIRTARKKSRNATTPNKRLYKHLHLHPACIWLYCHHVAFQCFSIHDKAYGKERPGRCPSKPTVLGFSKPWRIHTCNHLGVDIRLCSVYVRDVLQVRRAYLPVQLPCLVSVAVTSTLW